jgi:2-methylcitrate dehydratase PrpD
MKMNVSETLAANVINTRFEDLSPQNIERAKTRILDAVGCLIGGANAAGCVQLLNLVKQWGGAPEAHVLVHGVAAPAHNVAMLNSLMTRSYDFEPVEAEGENGTGPAHISGTTVPTALSMAERCSASGRELITALCLGDDLASRLSIASGFDFTLGWCNTGTINKFGAAAIAGKLLKLNQNQIHNSFGIVLNQLAGSMAGVWDKTMSFKLPIALACRDGIFAAELAQQGFKGVSDPFVGARGYFDLFTQNADRAKLTKDVGRRYYADCVIKPYPCCRANHSAIDTALKIAAQPGYRAEDILEIELNTAPAVLELFVGKPFTPGDTPQIDAAFSIRYTVANALLRKAVIPQHFTDAAIFDPAIAKLIGLMKLPGTLLPGGPVATEIKIKMKDGRVFAANSGVASGEIFKNPLMRDAILAKYRNNVEFSNTVSRTNAEKALAVIERLEDLKDVRELTALLIG